MNLYLLTQKLLTKYDVYDSCVVAAEDEYNARYIHPDGGMIGKDRYPTWVDEPFYVRVELIGTAKEGTEEGVIIGSFNAG